MLEKAWQFRTDCKFIAARLSSGSGRRLNIEAPSNRRKLLQICRTLLTMAEQWRLWLHYTWENCRNSNGHFSVSRQVVLPWYLLDAFSLGIHKLGLWCFTEERKYLQEAERRDKNAHNMFKKRVNFEKVHHWVKAQNWCCHLIEHLVHCNYWHCTLSQPLRSGVF